MLNPHYHVEVPANSAGFLKFRLGPVLYVSLTRLLLGQMWWSLFVWNAIWWALTCLAALWLFDRFLPRRSTLLVLTGLSMLMFFNFGLAREEISGWPHFPSPDIFGTIGLPYIRSFSPQVVMPVLFLYLGLQVLALQRRNSWWAWGSMVALQLFAFAVFPYTTPLLAGVTAVAVAGMFLSAKRDLDWRSIVLFGIVCAIVDTTFLVHGAPVFSTHSSSVAVFHYEWVFLKVQMGKLWLFLGLLTILVACSRTLAPELRFWSCCCSFSLQWQLPSWIKTQVQSA